MRGGLNFLKLKSFCFIKFSFFNYCKDVWRLCILWSMYPWNTNEHLLAEGACFD